MPYMGNKGKLADIVFYIKKTNSEFVWVLQFFNAFSPKLNLYAGQFLFCDYLKMVSMKTAHYSLKWIYFLLSFMKTVEELTHSFQVHLFFTP